jgi:hypothetical protein
MLPACGGGGSSWQEVVGDGYSFSAPAAWTVTKAATSTAASSGPVSRVEVATFRLARAYRPRLFARSKEELDRVAAAIAAQLRGHVQSSSVVRAAGREARSYTIGYREIVQEITFVFDGLREYELLCRHAVSPAGTPACGRLVASFALATPP